MSIPVPDSGCWLWVGTIGNKGYGRFGTGTTKLGTFKSHPAHRASYQVYRGPIPDGMFVCHKCDVRSCVNPDHLFIGTNLDNNRDMVRKGRAKLLKGSSNGFARLNEEQAYLIRHGHPELTNKQAAELYDVSVGAVNAVRTNRTWRHIKSPNESPSEEATDQASRNERRLT